MDRSAEMVAQEAELTTEQLSSCLNFVTGTIGSGPSSRSGFLGQFWGMLWDILAARSASGQAGAAAGLSGILSQMMGKGPGVTSPPPQPIPDTPDIHRLRFNMAMSAAGLSGRDPSSLTAAEKTAVASTLQSIPGPVSQSSQQMQQQIIHYQAVLAQQQKQHQLLIQQYQMLQHQVKSGFMPPPPPIPHQQQQQLRRPPAPVSAEAEEAMMKYLQTNPNAMHPPTGQYPFHQPYPQHMVIPSIQIQSPNPTSPKPKGPAPTQIESVAQKSARLAGQKRTRASSTMSNVSPVDSFLNMPDFDGDETQSCTSSMTSDTCRRAVDAELTMLKVFDEINHERIRSVHISSDSLLIAAANGDTSVSIFSTQDRKLIGHLTGGHHARVSRARFSKLGKTRYLLTGAFDHSVHIWNLGQVGKPLEKLPEMPFATYDNDHVGLVVSVDIGSRVDDETGDVDTIASCDTEGTLIVRSIKEGKVLHTRSDSLSSTVRMICIETNGDSHIALAIEDRVDIYNWRLGEIVFSFKSPNGRPVIGVCWDPGLIVMTTDNNNYAWSLDFALPVSAPESYTGRLVAVFSSHGNKITSSIVARNQVRHLSDFMATKQTRFILIGSWKKLYVWKIEYERTNGKRIDERNLAYSIDAHDDLIGWITSSTDPDISILATGGFDSKLIMWRFDIHASSSSPTESDRPSDASRHEAPSAPAGSSSVDELEPILDFDPIAMFLNTDDL